MLLNNFIGAAAKNSGDPTATIMPMATASPWVSVKPDRYSIGCPRVCPYWRTIPSRALGVVSHQVALQLDVLLNHRFQEVRISMVTIIIFEVMDIGLILAESMLHDLCQSIGNHVDRGSRGYPHQRRYWQAHSRNPPCSCPYFR